MIKKLKRILPLLFILLAACGPTPQQRRDATATWQVYDNQVATVITGTEVARKQTEIALLPTETPQGPLPLVETLLSWPDIENLLEWDRMIMDRSFEEDNFYQQFNFCMYECNARAWEKDETGSLLLILLGRYSQAEETTLYFNQSIGELKASKSPSDFPLLDALALPDTARIADSGDGVVFVAQHGQVIMLIKVVLPHLDNEQRINFLGIFADRQLQKLTEAGY